MLLTTNKIIFLTVLILILSFLPKFVLPANIQTALNYIPLLFLFLYVIARGGRLLHTGYLNIIFAFSIVTLVFGEFVNIVSVYLPFFILFGLLIYDYTMNKGVEKARTLLNIFMFIGIFQILTVYFQMGIPDIGSYYGGWLYQGGFDLGITKGGLGFFGMVSLLWLVVQKRYIYALLLLLLFHPVFISSRLISVIGAILIPIHFYLIYIKSHLKLNKGLIAFIAGWGILLTGVFYFIFIKDSFDRLPSYIVGIDVIIETGNIFGLGFRNYQYYIIDNIDRLNETYSYLMPKNMSEYYTSAESMYADGFASYGILGIIILIIYNIVLLKNLKFYSRFTKVEKWLVLVWALFVWGGVAQDFTAANALFYIILGVNVALLNKYQLINKHEKNNFKVFR
jgi:hypothetical protein